MRTSLAVLLLILSSLANATELSPLEAYGRQPMMGALELSPKGTVETRVAPVAGGIYRRASLSIMMR
ncbi:MAG: hypothetical protein QNJ14_02715 [Woeseiaceae bacterium]|nr:hypothetical protein [Woeseiaceae bacterium]